MKNRAKPDKKTTATRVQRRKRQVRAAKNLAKGMPAETAMIEAGYSVNYAKSHAYSVVKKPYIQSIFTESVERVMQAEKKEFDDIVRPYVRALDAPLIVKSTTEGIACIGKDPETQEILPDHDVRMKAADRLVALYGGVKDDKNLNVAIGLTLEQLVMGSMEE